MLKIKNIIHNSISNNSNTEIGDKISCSLIRVASTRIFANPEQSVLELIANSIDSYNQSKPSIGKFGMGFFSVLYWICENNFDRSLLIESSYCENNIIKSFKAKLFFTEEDGLCVEYEEVLSSSDKTYVKITIECSNSSHFTYENIEQFRKEINKMSRAEDVIISINDFVISEDLTNLDKLVDIKLSVNRLSCEDKGVGISKDVLFNSLLIPTSSTKERIVFVEEKQKLPNIIADEKSSLKIIVNGVCIVDVYLNDFSLKNPNKNNYIIYLPSSSKLPVARDDIIYGEFEINSLKEQLNILIDEILSTTKNLIELFSLFEEYMKDNKQDSLFMLINEIKEGLMKREDIYFIPRNKFFKCFINNFGIQNYCYYPYVDKFMLCNQLEDLLKPYVVDYLFKGRKCIVMSLYNKIILEMNELPLYVFIDGDITDEQFINKLSLSSPNSLLIPYDVHFDLDNSDFASSLDDDVYDIYQTFHMTLTKKFQNVKVEIKYFNGYLKEYRKISNNKQMIDYISLLNNFVSSLDLKFPYGSEKKVRFFPIDCISIHGFSVFLTENLMDFSKEKVKRIRNKYHIEYPVENESVDVQKLFLVCLTKKSIKYSENRINSKYFPGVINEYFNKEFFDKIREHKDLKFNVNFVFNQEFINGINRRLITYSISLMRNSVIECINLPISYCYITIYEISLLSKELIKEFEDVVERCVNNEELMIFILTVVSFIEKEYLIILKDDCNGMFNYLLNEIRKKYDNQYLYNSIKNTFQFILGGNLSVEGIIKDMKNSMKQFISSLNLQRDYELSEEDYQYSFTCKSLLSYVYNNEIDDLFDVIEDLQEYEYEPFSLQIVRIACNEGTTKPYIEAIMVELMNNSIDAIKSNYSTTSSRDRSKDKIEVKTYNDGVSVKDYIGIDNLIPLLIPFLSSKNPNDVDVVGEMGTGFFNVYRQPHTNYVVIDIVKDKRSIKIHCVPMIENNAVIDIQYFMNVSDIDINEDYTEINIVFNKNEPSIINDIHILVESKLGFNSFIDSSDETYKFIVDNLQKIKNSSGRASKNSFSLDELKKIGKCFGLSSNLRKQHIIDICVGYAEKQKSFTEIDIFLNGDKMNKQCKKIFSMENIGEVLMIDENKSSMIYVGNSYFCDLKDFKYDNLIQQFIEVSNKGVIINFYKNSFIPNQGRNRIRFHKDLEINKFINDGLFISILYSYVHHKSCLRDLVIDHSTSKANVVNVKLNVRNGLFNYNNIPYKNELLRYVLTNYIIPSSVTCLSIVINANSEVKFHENVTFDTNLIKDVTDIWFSCKDKSIEKKENIIIGTLKTKDSKSEGTEIDEDQIEFIKQPWKHMQVFVNEYWKILENMFKTRELNGLCGKLQSTPMILFGKSANGVNTLGFYSSKNNCIVINEDVYDIKAFDKNIELLKKMNERDAIMFIQTNEELIKHFANNSVTTLIHELGHAIENTNHNCSSHGLTKLSLNNGDKMMFDEMCFSIYNKAIQKGLLNNFIKNL